MYRVIRFFTDSNDNEHPYDVGDVFPRPGVTVSKQRLAELAGSNNRQGKPLILHFGAKEAEPATKTPAKKTTKKAAKE